MKKIACAPQVGADVEFFCLTNEGIIPVVGIIPGTKEKPYSKDVWKEGYGLQEDNVMIEVNIPPAMNHRAFATNMSKVKTYARRELQQRLGVNEVSLSREVTNRFTKTQLDSPQAQLIGCDPDLNAYEGGIQRNPPEEIGQTRSCGGHVHLGGDFKCPDFVAALFAEAFYFYYGCPIDAKSPRRNFYGAPGSYREKPYGIEYRTPSNLWATSGYSETVGMAMLHCAKWLTNSSATVIHRAFRQIEWDLLREAISGTISRDNKFKLTENIALSGATK